MNLRWRQFAPEIQRYSSARCAAFRTIPSSPSTYIVNQNRRHPLIGFSYQTLCGEDSLRRTVPHRMTIRGVAEHFSRGVVFRRRLPSRFRRLPLYVTPEAGLRYWLSMSRVDPILYEMAQELVKPGSVVWDIGANVGLFSFCAAALSGPSGFVLSVEPDLWLANLITRSAQQLSAEKYACSPIHVLCGSISDSIRISELQIAERARASNQLAETTEATQGGGSRYSQTTICTTLDFLLSRFPAPSVLKIDVESHEVSVLKGALKLLKTARPVIWCEVLDENSEEVTSLLRSAGYELYGAATQPHQRIDRAWFHTLALPYPASAATCFS